MINMEGFKLFFRRIFLKMIFIYFLVNILFALLITRRIYGLSQVVEIREWDERLISIVAFIVLFVKRIINDFLL